MKKYVWLHLNDILENTYFFKNIFNYILIFQYMGYTNSYKTMHQLTIYFFLKSPYNSLNDDKIIINTFNTFKYHTGRNCYTGRQIRWYNTKMDLEIDKSLLPTFSLLNYKEVSPRMYKMFKSFTYYPSFQLYFEYSGSLIKRNGTYITNRRIQNYCIKYFYFLFFFCSNKNYKSYFNTNSSKFNSFVFPNLNIYKRNLVQKDYKVSEQSILLIKKSKKHRIKVNYSFPLKFVIVPFFFFEIPFTFVLELLNYSEWNLIIYPPFMIYMWFIRYLYHRKHMVKEIIRKRALPWTNNRHDFCDIRWRPVFDPRMWYVVEPASGDGTPWVWGWIWTNYPRKGGFCMLW